MSHDPSVQIIKVHCRCLQFYITEGQLAIISTIIPCFQPKIERKKRENSDVINPFKWSACACANHITHLVRNIMGWPGQIRIQVPLLHLLETTNMKMTTVLRLQSDIDKKKTPCHPFSKMTIRNKQMELIWKKVDITEVSAKTTQTPQRNMKQGVVWRFA